MIMYEGDLKDFCCWIGEEGDCWVMTSNRLFSQEWKRFSVLERILFNRLR